MNDVATLVLSAIPAPGGFIATYKIILMLLFAVPWLWVCAWVDKDTVRVHAPKLVWTGAVLGAGTIGLAAWILLPMFAAGMCVYIVLVAAACGVYVIQRNAKVIPEAKILTKEHLSSLFERTGPATQPVTKLKAYNQLGKPVLPPTDGDDAEVETYNTVQDILYDVIWRRASDADFKPAGEHMSIRYVIDGVVIKRPKLVRRDVESAIEYIKAMAGLDIEEKRRPQTGKISVDLASEPMDLNVTVAGSTSGQRLQLKVIQEAIRTDITKLGMTDKTRQRIEAINKKSEGLILIAARPGNGVTSTLYSLLRVQDAYTKLLVSVEENPEVDMENITQHKYDGPTAMAATLAGTLRHDPDVVMVDKCPDTAGAAIVLKGAADKKILMGVSARDSFHALGRWVKVTGNTKTAVEPLQAVLSQVLCRKLCPACREAYRPDPAIVRKVNLPTEEATKFYRPPSKPLTNEKGEVVICATCQGSGYYGRTAAFELLEITDDLRQTIMGGANLTRIKAEARKKKMQYLQEVALRLVMAGVTSIEEVIRVTRTKQE